MTFIRPLCASIFLLAVFASFSQASSENLFERFEGKSVKVYVADPTDTSENPRVPALILKKAIMDGLEARKSVRFAIVLDPAQADLRVDSAIKGYFWTDHDPVDMLMGTASIAADAALLQDFARIDVDWSVSDVQKDRILWKGTTSGDITKKPMSEADSIPLVTKDVVKSFIRECFGRRRQR